MYSSGSSAGKHAKTGASTLVELFKMAGLVTEQDGQVTAVENIELANESISIPDNSVMPTVKQEMSTEIRPTVSQGMVSINININVSVSELDELTEKLKKLMDELKG